MTWRRDVLVLLSGAVVGGLVVFSSTPRQPAERADTAEPQRERPAPLVCARVRAPRSVDFGVEHCAGAEVALGVLEGQLRACEESRKRVRNEWTEDLPEREHPAEWIEAVERGIDACNLPVSVDVVECSEYPCVGGLRFDEAQFDGQDAEDIASSITSALGACGPLKEAFSIAGDDTDALRVHALDVPCPGEERSETVYVLAAFDTAGPAWETWSRRDEDLGGTLRWMFRRADDVVSAWTCGPAKADIEHAP